MKKEVLKARQNFEKRKFLERNANQKEFFKFVDFHTKSNNQVQNLVVDDRVITDDQDKANAFAQQYNSVFSSDNNVIEELDDISLNSITDGFTITEADVVASFREMNPSSSPGPT